MSRLYFLVFSGETRADAEIKHHIHESPGVMVGPLVVLAVGAGAGRPGRRPGRPAGSPGVEPHRPLAGAGPRSRAARRPHHRDRLHGHLDRAGGRRHRAGLGLLRRRLPRAGAEVRVRRSPASSRWCATSSASTSSTTPSSSAPSSRFARRSSVVVDRILIDKVLVEGTGIFVDVVGRLARFLQTGDGQRYMAVFAIGVAGAGLLRHAPHR